MEIKQGMRQEYERYVSAHSQNPYYQGAVKMMEIWGGMMEKVMEHGLTVEAAAEITSDAAQIGAGASGASYIAGRAALQRYWVHGDELKAWSDQKQAQAQAEVDTWYEQTGAKEMAELKAQRAEEQDGQGFGMTMGM